MSIRFAFAKCVKVDHGRVGERIIGKATVHRLEQVRHGEMYIGRIGLAIYFLNVVHVQQLVKEGKHVVENTGH